MAYKDETTAQIGNLQMPYSAAVHLIVERPDIADGLERCQKLKKIRASYTPGEKEDNFSFAEAVIDRFWDNLKKDPEVEKACLSHMTREDYISIGSGFSDNLSSAQLDPHSRCKVVQALADACWDCQEERFASAAASYHGMKMLGGEADQSRRPRIVAVLDDSNAARPQSPNEIPLSVEAYKAPETVNKILTYVFQEGLEKAVIGAKEGLMPEGGFFREAAGIIQQHGYHMAIEREDVSFAHLLASGLGVSMKTPRMTPRSFDLTWNDTAAELCEKHAYHMRDILDRANGVHIANKMTDKQLRDLTPRQRRNLTQELYKVKVEDAQDWGDFMPGQQRLAERLINTLPEDPAFSSIFNAASQQFRDTNPLRKLEGWSSHLAWEGQRYAVATAIGNMEAAWQAAATAGGAPGVLTPENAPRVAHSIHGPFTGEPHLISSGAQDQKPTYSEKMAVRFCKEDFGGFDKEHRPVLQRNAVLIHYGSCSLSSTVPWDESLWNRYGEETLAPDPNKPKGQVIYMPRLNERPGPKRSTLDHSDEKNLFWRYVHPSDVLHEITRLHIYTVRERIRLASQKRGETGPLAEYGRRNDFRSREGDICALFHYVASPAAKVAHMNPDAQRIANAHPYYAQSAQFLKGLEKKSGPK